MFALNFVLFLSILTLVALVIANANQDKWKFFGFHMVMRAEEFMVVFSTLLFIAKEKPANSDRYTDNSDAVTLQSISVMNEQ
jgi:hypothetical protein